MVLSGTDKGRDVALSGTDEGRGVALSGTYKGRVWSSVVQRLGVWPLAVQIKVGGCGP